MISLSHLAFVLLKPDKLGPLPYRPCSNGARSPGRKGPAACYVLSPVPLRLTPLAASLSSDAKIFGGAVPCLRALCAHPRRTNSIKTLQRAPVPIPWVQPVPASVTGAWRAKTAAPSLSCICHNCDLMEQSGNAAHTFFTGCSVTLQLLSLHSQCLFHFSPSFSQIFIIPPSYSLCPHTIRFFISVHPQTCNPSHPFIPLICEQWCTQLVTQGCWLSLVIWLMGSLW